jgi:hypothetical protein
MLTPNAQGYIRQWIESTEDAIKALEDWKVNLEHWQRHSPDYKGEFLPAFRGMSEQGLDGWLDGHPLDIDKLANTLCGEDVP